MKATSGRLNRELTEVLKNGVDGVLAVATEGGDLYCIHFLLAPSNPCDYKGGRYWGKFVFPRTYPQAPPALYFLTPSGRFEPGVKVCASFTDFHPESWTISWRLSTLLLAVLSFMQDESPTAGSISSSGSRKRELAAKSHLFNAQSPLFRKIFSPDLIDEKRGREMLALHRQEEHKKSLLMMAGLISLFAVVVIWRLV